MVEYTEKEQRIAKFLLEGSKTVLEIREKTGLTLPEVNEALKKLITLRVAEKTDEDKYKLISYVEEQIKGFKGEVKQNYRAMMIIEALSMGKEALEKQLGLLEEKLKREKIKIIKMKTAEAQQQGENYTSYIELECYTTDFSDLMTIIINYGPSSVELLEPKEVKLNLTQAQNTLNEVISAVHYYVALILSLKQLQMKSQQKKAEEQKSKPEEKNEEEQLE